jgi:hydrogenase nickel incorporation protein HypA/HybF
MHEYPITQHIVKLVEEAARKQHAARVTKITLVVGEQSGFVGDSIHLYFDIISRGTLAEGAELSIIYIQSKLLCRRCNEHFARARYSFACPRCGEDGVPTDIGKEFYIQDIEVETDGERTITGG